jgi:hypothetical protein
MDCALTPGVRRAIQRTAAWNASFILPGVVKAREIGEVEVEVEL